MENEVKNKDERGRFTKGNRLGQGSRPKDMREFRDATKNQIGKCGMLLTLPWATVEIDMQAEGITRLEYLVLEAIKNRNHKFIMWLVEMVIGKAKQAIEVDDEKKELAPFKIEFLDGRTEVLGAGKKPKK